MVIAIIAILAAMLLPVLSKSKAMALNINCESNLKQLQLCWHMYYHDNDDVLTPNNFVYDVTMGSTNGPTLGEDQMTWCRGLAPLDTNMRSPAAHRCFTITTETPRSTIVRATTRL